MEKKTVHLNNAKDQRSLKRRLIAIANFIVSGKNNSFAHESN